MIRMCFVAAMALILLSACVRTEPVIKPYRESGSRFNREVHVATLPSGLDVVMVSDPDMEHAEASVVVNVGKVDDPVGYAGVAHLLEHIVGTGYRDTESVGFQGQVLTSGGHYRAETHPSDTVYAFSGPTPALRPLLEELLSLFRSSTLNTDGISEEIRTLREERMHGIFVEKEGRAYIKGHIENHKFFPRAGVFDVYSGLEAQFEEAVVHRAEAMYDRRYTAQNMALAVVSPHSAETVLEMVRSSLSGINIKSNESPSGRSDRRVIKHGNVVRVEVPSGDRVVELVYSLQDDGKANYRSSLHYVLSMLMSKHKGSLLDVVSSRGWSDKLTLSRPNNGHGQRTQIRLKFVVNKAGWKSRDSLVAMVNSYFQYLSGASGQAPLLEVVNQRKQDNDVLDSSSRKIASSAIRRARAHLASLSSGTSPGDLAKSEQALTHESVAHLLDQLAIDNADVYFLDPKPSELKAQVPPYARYVINDIEKKDFSDIVGRDQGFSLPERDTFASVVASREKSESESLPNLVRLQHG